MATWGIRVADVKRWPEAVARLTKAGAVQVMPSDPNNIAHGMHATLDALPKDVEAVLAERDKLVDEGLIVHYTHRFPGE